MGIDFLPDKPIYQQLIDKIIGEIIKGTLQSGDKLPSVREYAVEVGVNANTMQRVYKELEQMQITETRRGQGSFVTNDQVQLVKLREHMKEQLVTSFIQNVEALGFTAHEIITVFEKRSVDND